MIDTHCHILPAMDDGPSDMDISLEMASIAVADGIGTIIATPHIVEGIIDGSETPARVVKMQKALDDNGIEIRILPGAEVPISTCLASDAGYLKSLALAGGSYLLIETAETTYEQLMEAAYRVRLNGLYPVLAHPERAIFVQQQPERLAEMLRQRQAFCQVTAASLEGLFGKRIRKTAVALLRLGAVHLVATDAHSAGRRSPRLSASYSIVKSILGEAAARQMFIANPPFVSTRDSEKCSRSTILLSRPPEPA